MRVVLDTNVLLAAFGAHGLCEVVVIACLNSHETILSEPILAEFAKHLPRKFKVPLAQTREMVKLFREQAEIVRPADVAADACRDSKDLMVLGTALAGKADCIVTGDADLLTLSRFQGALILSPRGFYERLR